jgi:endonuclease YncB( thermonuclease family)
MANMIILFYAAMIAFILVFPAFQMESHSVNSQSGTTNSKPALPSETLSEGIEISGPVNYVVDGDTLEVNDIRIRLSLVNTPEVGELGFDSAKDFVENLCLDKNGQVDIDDGQRQGSFGREIGVV